MSRNDTLLERLRTASFDRRQLVGGAAGVATAATAAVALGSLVSAQTTGSSTATPEAGSGSSSGSSETTAERAAAITDRSAKVIASVKADRDALPSSIDASTIDELLSLAADLQTKAEAATLTTRSGRRSGSGSGSGSGSSRGSSSSTSATPEATTTTGTPAASSGSSTASSSSSTPGKVELAYAAARTAQAARAMMVAQLANFGLPSQQARLSRDLATAYDDVKAIASKASSGGVEDASTLVTHAEAAYKSAYEAYTAKTYARATAYGEATAHLGEAAAALLGLRRAALTDGWGGRSARSGDERREMAGRGGMKGGRGGRSGSSDGSGSGSKSSSDATATPSASDSSTSTSDNGEESTPVDVPEPSF